MVSQIYTERMTGVILMTNKNAGSSTSELIRSIEEEGSTEKAKLFFQQEKEFLAHVFNLEKDAARSMLRKIQKTLFVYTPKFTIGIVKYYYIVLSSIIARKMQEKALLNEENAFTFNAACIEMIESNLNDHNTVEIGDELVEFYCYVLKEKDKPLHSHETVNEVIKYINENVEKQLIVEEIAKRFNVSTSHLSRIFREYTSVTLVEYITIRKVEEVQYYLRFSDQKIADIAEKFNFCNQSYFTRVFKKYTGLTPGRFRKDVNGNYFRFTAKEDDSL